VPKSRHIGSGKLRDLVAPNPTLQPPRTPVTADIYRPRRTLLKSEKAGEPEGGRPGLQVGPPGRWWDDRGFAKNIKLRPDQQTRMDQIFEQNRGALINRFQSVMQAQAQLDALASSPSPDEAALFAQIDRVAQARAELEKANTHYLLQLRKEMDADQIQRLEKSAQK
jgi:Spy/CpxP family protein refolding chaperone